MISKSFDSQGRRRRFDLVAYDQHDSPILVVEVKASGDTRSVARFVEDTKVYASAAARNVPFFLVATPNKIELFKQNQGEWSLVRDFDSLSVLRYYDERFGEDPVFESYLASLLQVWLNDIAYGWHGGTAPEKGVFEQLGLVDALREGSIAAGASL